MDYLSNFFSVDFYFSAFLKLLLFRIYISCFFFSNKLNSCIKNIYFNLYRVYIYK